MILWLTLRRRAHFEKKGGSRLGVGPPLACEACVQLFHKVDSSELLYKRPPLLCWLFWNTVPQFPSFLHDSLGC